MCTNCASLNNAEISDDRKYRYLLRRCICEVENSRTLLFIMLNPSTANATEDDATIRRCREFARRWEYGILEIVNLFAVRIPQSRGLEKKPKPIGPKNNDKIKSAANLADLIVCAWGNRGTHLNRAAAVKRLLAKYDLLCIELNLTGEPRHPRGAPYRLQPLT